VTFAVTAGVPDDEALDVLEDGSPDELVLDVTPDDDALVLDVDPEVVPEEDEDDDESLSSPPHATSTRARTRYLMRKV
jgi:hypothetical protein